MPNMFKEFKKELLLAAVFTAVLFWLSDFLGDFMAGPEPDGITISAGLMMVALLMLVLPAFIGTVPSGFLVGKKTRDVKATIFVPAVGAAIGVIVIMALSAATLIFAPDAVLESRMAEATGYGLDFFAGMAVQEYRALLMVSLAFGAVFLALINFAVGLAGGFAGRMLSKAGKAH